MFPRAPWEFPRCDGAFGIRPGADHHIRELIQKSFLRLPFSKSIDILEVLGLQSEVLEGDLFQFSRNPARVSHGFSKRPKHNDTEHKREGLVILRKWPYECMPMRLLHQHNVQCLFEV